MFSIVWLHALCQGPFCNIPMRSMLSFGVPGFVFISGYFGIKFKWRKIFGLYGIALFASTIAPMSSLLSGDVGCTAYLNEVLRVWNPESGFWFLHAYAALTMLSPLLNSAIPTKCDKQSVYALAARSLPLLILVFVIFGLRSFNHLRPYVPNVPGGQALVFCAIYMIGRLFAISKIADHISSGLAGLVALFALAIAYFTNGMFNFWTPLFVAVSLFVLFSRIKVSGDSLACKAILAVSPHMFGVYCIHGTLRLPFAEMSDFGTLNYLSETISSFMPIPLALVLSALAAFWGALMIDLLRHVLLGMIVGKYIESGRYSL